MDNKLVELNRRTFKVDRLNFFALTRGMEKDDQIIKTAIFVQTSQGRTFPSEFIKKPKLITVSKSNPFTPSDIGRNLLNKYKNEKIEKFEYAAVLSTIFHINNKIEVWEKFCNNGIFDIWPPDSPFDRLSTGKDPMILLLKVYKIDRPYTIEDIDVAREDYIKNSVDNNVLLKTPVIQQNKFDEIYTTIKNILKSEHAYRKEESSYIENNNAFQQHNGSEIEDNFPKNDDNRYVLPEEVLVSSIHNHIHNQGFTFDKNTIINYYISLKTKPFVILSGITGTGKTKLTKLFADAVCQSGEKGDNPQYLLVPVGPDWNENRFLLGYYNPLTEKYNRTQFLNFIIKASDDTKNPYFVCLDEMNLARVEYYFSTFLSAMETADRIIQFHEFPDSDTVNGASYEDLMKYADIVGIKKHEDVEALKKEITNVVSKLPPAKIKIPDNLFITGTVNMDETTFQFSPKVLDRANAIEFTEVDLSDKPKYDNQRNPINSNEDIIDLFKKYVLDDEARFENDDEYKDWESKNWSKLIGSKEIDGFLIKINNELEKSNLHFGYRTRNEILKYLYFSRNLYSDEFNKTIAKDNQILQKILPKIKGPEKIRDTLGKLVVVIDDYKRSKRKLNEMIEALDNGYTSFYQ